MTKVWQRYQLFPSRNIDDQETLESDLPKGKPGHTQPRMAVSNATFPWWLSSSKIIKNINWFFLVLLLIKETFNLIGWLTQKATTNQKSKDIDYQWILQSDWSRGKTDHIQQNVVASDAALIYRWSIDSFQRYWW